MIDEGDLLERVAGRLQPAPGAVERVLRRRDRKRRNQRVAAGSLALLVAVVGILALIPFAHIAHVAHGNHSAMPGGVVPEAGTWTRVRPSDPSVFADADLRAVTPGGPGFVAVGDISTGDSPSPVWTSPDGIDWFHVPAPDAPRSIALWDVVSGHGGLVAVGVASGQQNTLGKTVPGIPGAWFSSDGVHWRQATVEPSQAGGEYADAMFGVISTDPGFIAWGRYGGGGYVWTSTDGRRWSTVADESVFASNGDVSISDVAVGGPGYVAVGSERPEDGARTGAAVVWTSPDGRTWTRQTPEDAGFDPTGWTSMNVVFPGGPGLIAIGDSGKRLFNTSTTVWTSIDGREWEEGPPQSSFVGSGVVAVARSGDGYVAIGDNYSTTSEHTEGKVWTSPDGLKWTDVTDPTGTTFSSVAGGRVFMEGISGDRGVGLIVGVDQGAGASYQNKRLTAAVWLLRPA